MNGPFFELLPLCFALIGVCYLLSIATREYSWVDRIWSIAPPVYLWVMTYRADFQPRLIVMSALATAWGIRLTYNFARKGGYRKGGEDYRWSVLKQRLGPVRFQLFNATFIAPYQNVLIFLLTAPAYAVATGPKPLTFVDAILAVAFILCLFGETLADQQQWIFHQEKSQRQAAGKNGPEFCATGLFRFSRHPNFAFEISQWWLMYGFSIVASGQWLNFTIIGAVLLTLLFDGSIRFTEAITKSKYPSYAEYQRTTSRLLPWFAKNSST